jgi:catechol 2,3-dioxygenase-like lactoylglutathione lyase family enzyme
MIKSLMHVGIGTQDYEKMLTFYRDVLGLKVTFTKPHPNFPGGKVTFLSAAEGEVLELTQYPNPRPPIPTVREKGNAGVNHFGFLVDDLDEEYRRLKEHGIEFEGELPPKVPGKRRTYHFWDPEGNRVHMTEMP